MADSPEERNKLRLDRINGKGLEVATKLSELLAGKDVDLATLNPYEDDPNIKKEERLRAYLDQINAARRRLLDGDFGACQACGETFRAEVLDETPWIGVCEPCIRAGRPRR